MNKKMELSWNELKTSYNPSDFSFSTTNELLGSEGIIGQDSAIETFEFGLKLEAVGYNIYVSADDGKDKLKYIINLLKKYAETKPVPEDLCYIYNFKNPGEPKLIHLQAGDGKRFKEDMGELCQFLMKELPLKLQSYTAEKRRKKVLLQFEELKEQHIIKLNQTAKEKGFLMEVANEGIVFLPAGKGKKPLTKKEYDLLEEEDQKVLQEKLEELYSLADDVIENLQETEKKYTQYLEDINEEMVLEEIGCVFKHLKDKYRRYEVIGGHLDAIGDDIIHHLPIFAKRKDEEEALNLKNLLAWSRDKEIEKIVKQYEVNLLVDHEKSRHAPIVTGFDLSKTALIGKTNIDTEGNVVFSDFTNIKPGLFHKAHGGYLVVYAKDLFENRGSWETMKKVLRTGQVAIDNLEDINLAGYIGIKPQSLKLNTKVIMLGTEEVYSILMQHDQGFRDLFKVKVEFEEDTDNSNENIYKLACMIKSMCEQENLKPVSIEGILRIAKYGSRLAEDPKKITSSIESLLDLVREANVFATHSIGENEIMKAIVQRQKTKSRLEKKIDQKIKNDAYLIDTEGEKVGQINALAVYSMGEVSFGKPIRISVTTYKGLTGIVDIEKEAALSGNIHTKGIHIITGFLGYHFAQDMTLSLSCRICFEQSYSEVDGDSASSAELYGILSSLADIPIKQNIAVTGSVNQFGQIQPIGGVNEKIEGFFRTCKQKGLRGDEGVMIPYQNRAQLILDDEVVEAVKLGKFHIYAVSHIQEGIEIITGRKYKEIEDKVKEKLRSFNKMNLRDRELC